MMPSAAPIIEAKSPLPTDNRWVRWGYIFIGVFFISRLLYIASGSIEVSEDEAYQWLWSKHLALSYYSKPPLIAYLQFLGTSIFGDNEFGIRFLSPVMATALSVLLLRFLAREGFPRAGFWLMVMMGGTPLLALGSTLLTVDAPSVFFWVAAMIAGWGAIQSSSLAGWILTGFCVGGGLLSKYTAVIQILSFAIFLTAWKPARAQFRTAGPYLALAIAVLAFLPVIFWNIQHDWITIRHLAERGGLDERWRFHPGFLPEFLVSEFGLLNPIFFAAIIWAIIAWWKNISSNRLFLFLFCMGAPLFLFYTLYTLRARVLPNWIAPSVIPLLALLALIGDDLWTRRYRRIKRVLITGLVVGYIAVTLMQATELTKVFTGYYVPAKFDPLHRVRGWKEIAAMLGLEREKALAEGKPVFLIAQHYGLASILTFYLPEAKKSVAGQPLVYYIKTDLPKNQFYFWPGYDMRKGENAIYIEEVDRAKAPPRALTRDFAEVIDLGVREAFYHGQVFRHYQIYLCRNLR